MDVLTINGAGVVARVEALAEVAVGVEAGVAVVVHFVFQKEDTAMKTAVVVPAKRIVNSTQRS
jgi:hypothetical protein